MQPDAMTERLKHRATARAHIGRRTRTLRGVAVTMHCDQVSTASEKSRYPSEESSPARLWESDQQQTVVRARCVLASIREVQILRDEETAVGLRGLPHDIVVLAGELFVRYGVDVVSE